MTNPRIMKETILKRVQMFFWKQWISVIVWKAKRHKIVLSFKENDFQINHNTAQRRLPEAHSLHSPADEGGGSREDDSRSDRLKQ